MPPPRKVNAQVVVFSEHASGPCVLLQLRSQAMPVMPGYLATVGGMRDETDADSTETARREVFEETGLLDALEGCLVKVYITAAISTLPRTQAHSLHPPLADPPPHTNFDPQKHRFQI